MRMFTNRSLKLCLTVLTVAVLLLIGSKKNYLESSSHREAPMIANDPLADNTDVYAFRNPNNPKNMVIIANYIPFQLPFGGPNFYFFGEHIAYDIHIKNNAATKEDDILYRFEFKLNNEDPSTFFRIRLGKENLKNTYTCKKSTDGGKSFTTIISNGVVPPYNVGPRSIESAVGLNSNYDELMKKGIMTASSGEKIFAGPVDDPFFVDFSIFDLGNVRKDNAVNGLRRMNVHSIVLDIPIEKLQKDGKSVKQAKNILDPDFVIGVWASASRPKMTVRSAGEEKHEGPYVQVSRLGMPLTNEVVIPIGDKDKWNSVPSTNDSKEFEKYFTNPELALYMDESQFGGAVPGLASLRIQSKSLGAFDFRNGKDGLFPLLNNPAVKGTALDPALFGNYLLRDDQPRSVDLLPIFMTGVPNLPPYQLVTGKAGGNPLAVGKPFINNFLPTFGDMLRVNMAVPVTDRKSADFSSLGLVQAAALGITDPRFNMNFALQAIPNMDGFPNGRRLEDDVTRIELQAVSGIVLAAVGLGYDDYDPAAGAGTISAVQKQNSGNLVLMPPPGAVITGIQSATYGSGTGNTAEDFKFDASCQVDVTETVRKVYNYKITNATPNFEISVGTFTLVGRNDPCPGVRKTLKVVATYRMGASLATQNLVNVLSFSTGVEKNDKEFQTKFPFEASPWRGTEIGGLVEANLINDSGNNTAAVTAPAIKSVANMGLAAPEVMVKQIESFPNPARDVTTFRYRVSTASNVSLRIYDAAGDLIVTPVNNQQRAAGTYEVPVNVSKLKSGIYYARVQNGNSTQSVKFIVTK